MTKEITLTRGYTTIVSDEDYDMLSNYKWYASDEISLRKPEDQE